MGCIISNIYNYFYPPDGEQLKHRVDRELNEWIVRQYLSNTYLVKIPQERISLKRDEIEMRLSKKYF